MRRTCASLMAFVLAVLVLCPAPGAAAPRQAGRAAAGAAASGGSPFWDAVWMGFPALAVLWEKIVPGMDPKGEPLKARLRPVARKIGPGGDPDGQPFAPPQPSEPQVEIGPGMDPDGL